MPIKGQSKTTKTITCRFFTKNNTYWGMILDRCWTKRIFNLRLCNVEEINSSSSSWKSCTSRRWWSGSILENSRESSETFPVMSSLVWRKVEEEHGRKRRKQATIPVLHWFFKKIRVPPSLSRSFRTQSHWSYSTRQCCFSKQPLPIHLSHRMCHQFTFHHQFGIGTRTSTFEQQTDSNPFCLWDPMDKNHKDPETIDLNEPRHAQYMHKAWKRHQNTVYWVDINLALRKGLNFNQSRSNAIILHETLPTYCIPKVVGIETGEVTYEKVYMSPRPPPKISLKHDWKRELGSEDAQRPEGQVVQQYRSFQSNQPNPNPSHDRTGQPVVRTDRTGQPVVRTDRTGQPVVETHTDTVPEGSQTRSCHESISFNVGDEQFVIERGNPL